jgi:hypothetical protein
LVKSSSLLIPRNSIPSYLFCAAKFTIASKSQSGQPSVEKDNLGVYFFDTNDENKKADAINPELVFKKFLLEEF